MYIKYKITTFLLAFVGVCILFGAQDTFGSTNAPEWQKEQEVDTTAFRYKVDVPSLNIEVPTVVEFTVVGASILNKTAVVSSVNGKFQSAFFKTYHEHSVEQQQTVTYNGIKQYVLNDTKLSTTVNFPFYEGGGTRNIVNLTFTTQEPITTSVLSIVPDINVTLPEKIKIGMVDSDGAHYVVVANKTLNGTTVSFPETTASEFSVEFELVQPLRLAEINFILKREVVKRETIRFLAQPDERYVVYIDSDRSYGRVETGGVNLQNDKDVFIVDVGVMQGNPLFVKVDSDKDGVSDEYDNCPNVSNVDQRDIDRNGKGDVCDDFDRDGVMASKDNCPEIPNRYQEDTDGDGVGDACDKEEDRLTERSPWIPWVGMGIAGLVLISLLVLSVRSKDLVPVGTNDKEDEPESKTDDKESVEAVSGAVENADKKNINSENVS